jgi:hypothetical protein
MSTQDSASGGFGMAKAAFLFGNEWIEVNTVKNGRRYKFKASRETLLNDAVEVSVEAANKNAHGTTIIIKVPKKINVDGDDKHVWFPHDISNISFFKQPMLHNSIEIRHKNEALNKLQLENLAHESSTLWGSDFNKIKTGKHFDLSKYGKPTKINFAWGHADLYINEEFNSNKHASQHSILSAGVHQFNEHFTQGFYEPIPHDIILNVFPTVEADAATYPFNIKREGWKNTIEKDIGALNLYIKNIAGGISAENTVKTFKNIKSLPKIDLESISSDQINPTDFITPIKPKKSSEAIGVIKSVGLI